MGRGGGGGGGEVYWLEYKTIKQQVILDTKNNIVTVWFEIKTPLLKSYIKKGKKSHWEIKCFSKAGYR